jgi:hypothetical protein
MHHRTVTALILVTVLLTTMLVACGGGDPYSGTWKAPKTSMSDPLTLVVKRANPGWWSFTLLKSGPPADYAAEISGELQTANGGTTIKRSGDHLELTMAPGDPPIVFTRQ